MSAATSKPAGRGWVRRIWEPSAAATLSAIPAVAFSRLFTGHHALYLLLAAAVIPAVVVGILRLLNLQALAIVAVALVALLAFLLWGVLAAESHLVPGGPAWSALGHGIHDGWRQLLTVGLPAAPTGMLEVTPVVVVWLTSTLSAVFVTNERTVLAPIAPPLVSLVIALGFVAGGSPASFPGLAFAAVFVAVAGLLAGTRTRPGAPLPPPDTPSREPALSEHDLAWAPAEMRSAVRAEGAPDDDDQPVRPGRFANVSRLTLALPAVVVLVALTLGVTRVLPVDSAQGRLNPRKWVVTPVQVSDQVSPLVAVNGLKALRPTVKLFTVGLTGGSRSRQPTQVRVADLDRYDGAEWTSDGTFQLSGSQLPVDPAPAAAHGNVALSVGVQSATAGVLGPYLPAAGTPAAITVETPGRKFAVDPRDDQLVVVGKMNGLRYRLSAIPVPAGNSSVIAQSFPATGAGLDAFKQLPTDPQVHDRITGWAQDIVAGANTPAEQLLDLQKTLRQIPTSPSAPPGDAWGEINQILARQRPADVAQLATAYALLARALGFPARVAVGYRLVSPHRHATAYEVTSADVTAWPEVDLAGLGWVAFQPVGTATDRAQPPKKVKTQKLPNPRSPVVHTQANASTAALGNGPGGPTAGGQGTTPVGLVEKGSLALAALLLLLAIPPASIVAAKKIRRRRRNRAPTPALRVLGAWQEVADRLLEQNLVVSRSWSPSELAAAVDRHFDPTPPTSVNHLAPLVTSTLFAPGLPDEEEANRSWELLGLFTEELHASGHVGYRRALLDPRPLLPRWRPW